MSEVAPLVCWYIQGMRDLNAIAARLTSDGERLAEDLDPSWNAFAASE